MLCWRSSGILGLGHELGASQLQASPLRFVEFEPPGDQQRRPGQATLLAAAVSLSTSWLLVSRLERIGARVGLSEALLGMVAALAADAPEITASYGVGWSSLADRRGGRDRVKRV